MSDFWDSLFQAPDLTEIAKKNDIENIRSQGLNALGDSGNVAGSPSERNYAGTEGVAPSTVNKPVALKKQKDSGEEVAAKYNAPDGKDVVGHVGTPSATPMVGAAPIVSVGGVQAPPTMDQMQSNLARRYIRNA